MPTGFTYPTYTDWAKNQRPPSGNPGVFIGNLPTLPNYYKNKNAAQLQYSAQNPNGGNFPSINLPDPTQYFDPAMIQQLFNTSRSNLYQSQNRNAAAAQRTAAATSGGYLSPGAFITNAGSQVRGAYAPAFGQLEERRAGALTENQRLLLQALMQKSGLEEQSRQFNVTDERTREQMARQYQLALQQLMLQRQQIENQGANFFDYLGALLPIGGLSTPGGSSLLGSLLFPNGGG